MTERLEELEKMIIHYKQLIDASIKMARLWNEFVDIGSPTREIIEELLPLAENRTAIAVFNREIVRAKNCCRRI